MPSANSRICSEHFLSDEVLKHFGKIALKHGSVPCIRVAANANISTPKRKKKGLSKRRLQFTPVSPMPSTSCEDINSGFADTVRISESASVAKSFSKRKVPVYFGDINPKNLKTPKLLQVWQIANKTITCQKKKLKYLQNKNGRLSNKIKSLNDLIYHLKNKKIISENCFDVLKENLPASEPCLLLRQLKLNTSRQYSEELRQFALTLHFCSSAAYNYVRKTFGSCLPHPKTLGKWYQTVDGSPGYTAKSLKALKIKVMEMKSKGKILVCNLVMDEMSIRQHVTWTGQQLIGYINYGFNMEGNDSLPEAKDVIVFMVVALNCRWKIPIGYFFISGLSGEERANLVKGSFLMLHDTGVMITSMTFDGAASNLSMANALGACLTYPKTYFDHPVTKNPVFIILDICHMIKLVRNTLGDMKSLYDKDGNKIMWEFFEKLVALQEEMQLHAATDIRRRHLNYNKEKMKVKLAVQTLSSSVAYALDYLCEDLEHKDFLGAKHTALFCRNINNLFDSLNTRNSLSKYQFKSALSVGNLEFVITFFNEMKRYITELKDSFGCNILYSRRKMGFLGFLITMDSAEDILTHYIKSASALDYLLTYKLSQDHLELFFSNIRARGGFNNNPTAIQFEGAYKRLLIHTEITSSTSANCLVQDDTSILRVTSSSKRNNSESEGLRFISLEDVDCTDEWLPVPDGPAYCSDIIEYIAGFISKRIMKKINCYVCISAVISEEANSRFPIRKNRGRLTKASRNIITICKIAETLFRSVVNFSDTNIINSLIIRGTRCIHFNSVFTELQDHILDQDSMRNHLIKLVYLILKHYFIIRIHHRNKEFNEVKDRIRHYFSKLIHFKHQ